jgi:hypothetical protein
MACQVTRTSCSDGADNVTGTSTVVVPESPSVPTATPGVRSGWKILSGMKVSSRWTRPKGSKKRTANWTPLLVPPVQLLAFQVPMKGSSPDGRTSKTPTAHGFAITSGYDAVKPGVG